DGGWPAPQSGGEGGRVPHAAPRRAAHGAAARSRHGVRPRAAGREASLRRRARVPERQGHRAAADGEVPCREGEAVGPRSATRTAQPVRKTHRAHGGRRSAWRRHGERRRRVLENGSNLVTKIRTTKATKHTKTLCAW